MNPRQRRAVLLLALAVAGLFGVFALVANYVSDIETEVGDKVVVFELTKPAKANEAISDDMVIERQVPKKWAPGAALPPDRGRLVGVVAAADIERHSILQEGMLVTPPEIQQNQREVAILVDAATGVAGKIEPGRAVDVIASYAAEPGDQDTRAKPKPARSIVIVPGARVIAVGTPRQKPANTAQDAQQDVQTVVPVTFALSKRQELRVAHAQVFAADVRLALLRPGDRAERTLGETIFKGEDPKRGDEGVTR
jgi:pilus assembly protein CpaB